MKVGKIYGIGLGPGDPKLLTLRALEALKSCDRVFEVLGANSKESVSGSILDGVKIEKSKRISLTYTMSSDNATRHAKIAENAATIAMELRKGLDCAFTTIGDPLIYSTFSYTLAELRRLIPEIEAEVVPGITSFQAAAAKACVPVVEDEETLLLAPCHSHSGIEKAFGSGADTLALLKASKAKGEILELAAKEGAETVYASRLGLEGEILTRNPAEIAAAPETYLSLLIVKRKAGK
jgi:precorrin-2/cobalt-factor-2 C20-methyltransferase